MFCRDCGNKFGNNEKYCSKCGAMNLHYISNVERKPFETTKKKKKLGRDLIIAIILFGAICFVLLLNFAVEILTESVETLNQSTTYSADGYSFAVIADDSWAEKPVGGAFELDLYNEEKDIYFHVMAYKKIDLVDDMKCEDIQSMQMDDLISKRYNAKEIEPSEVILENEDKTICACLYSAEEDMIKNYYYSFGIDLHNSEEILWVLINGMPTDILNNREMLEEMVMEIE